MKKQEYGWKFVTKMEVEVFFHLMECYLVMPIYGAGTGRMKFCRNNLLHLQLSDTIHSEDITGWLVTAL